MQNVLHFKRNNLNKLIFLFIQPALARFVTGVFYYNEQPKGKRGKPYKWFMLRVKNNDGISLTR